MTLRSLKSFLFFFKFILSLTRTHSIGQEESPSLHTRKPQICKGSCALTVCQSQSETVNKAKPVKRKPITWRPRFMPGGCLYRKPTLNSIMEEKKMRLRHARHDDLRVKTKKKGVHLRTKRKSTPFFIYIKN